MNRCRAFLDALKETGCNAALIHRPENIRWLTGYTGEGSALITDRTMTVITDFRYIEQCERQAPECACRRTGNGMTESEIVRELCVAESVSKLAVEPDFLTHDAFCALDNALAGIELIPLNQLPQELRLIKDETEIESIRRAASISCQAFDNLLALIHPGQSEKEIKALLEFEMLKLGSEKPAFDTIIAGGVNGSLPHAVPSDYRVQNGDLVTMDFGATVNGYCADMTRTIAFGHVSDELRELYNTVLTSQKMVLDVIRPGVCCGDMDQIARDYLEARYPGAFGHSLGHGVGLFIHEQPRLAKGSKTILVPGHVVTVEPGVYIPGLGGCRIEDMVIMTEDGYIDPITAPKHLIEL